MVFLANLLSKMKKSSPLGSRIAEVHNGSSLFTGDAGQGESNVRRWVIENDWLEAIIALPLNIFYNTGIATYIWILSNRKAPTRKGNVQLIDATSWFRPLRKNLGKKNCELGSEDIQRICNAYLDQQETEHSKTFPNKAFGYWKVTIDRPLRLTAELSAIALGRFRKACIEADEEKLATFCEELVKSLGAGPHTDFNLFLASFEKFAKKGDVQMTAKRQKLLMLLGVRDPSAAPVIKKIGKPKADADVDRDALYGFYHNAVAGKPAMIEYEPDIDLRDTEQVPFLEEGGIEAFVKREVLPHTPDSWIDQSKTVIGYEISFTRHFYKPQPLRTLEQIEADIRALEKETEGLLEDALVGGH
jgi:type I restriction enzyme M protein